MTIYTVCIWEARTDAIGVRTGLGAWMDDISFESRREAYGEVEFAHYDKPRGWVKVIKSDGTAADLIAKREALPAPARYRKEA